MSSERPIYLYHFQANIIWRGLPLSEEPPMILKIFSCLLLKFEIIYLIFHLLAFIPLANVLRGYSIPCENPSG
jgi:hypothetical protein